MPILSELSEKYSLQPHLKSKNISKNSLAKIQKEENKKISCIFENLAILAPILHIPRIFVHEPIR